VNKYIYLSWAFKNSVCVICWTALAIVFNKWWIALFSYLFLNSLVTKPKYYRICDACGKHSTYADTYNEALKKAKDAGWLHQPEGNKDYCPECQK
jgi:hypothetical protein